MSDRKTRSVGTLMANWNVDNKADWWLVSRLCPRTQFPPAYYLKLHHGQGEPGLLLVKRLVRRAYKHWQPAQIFFRYVDIIWYLMSIRSSHTFFISIFKCLIPNLLDLLSVCSKVGVVKGKRLQMFAQIVGNHFAAARQRRCAVFTQAATRSTSRKCRM